MWNINKARININSHNEYSSHYEQSTLRNVVILDSEV